MEYNKSAWDSCSRQQILSEGFIRKFQDFVNWSFISEYQKLSEDFIREFKDRVDWYFISFSQKLSESFIHEFQNKVDWDLISAYQKLSEDFISDFRDKVCWEYISKYQKLSEDFIREFKDKVNWYYISNFQKLSEAFIQEFNIEILYDNWNYKTLDYKQSKIEDTGLYEIQNGYIYAYKTVRSDYWSVYNFQLQYLPGTIVEDFHYDPNCSHENSFGISLWTREKALNYNATGKLIYCRAKIEDIHALVHEGNKLRCSKIEVLNELPVEG